MQSETPIYDGLVLEQIENHVDDELKCNLKANDSCEAVPMWRYQCVRCGAGLWFACALHYRHLLDWADWAVTNGAKCTSCQSQLSAADIMAGVRPI